MERKFIRINELKKMLSPKEMKNVLGGSGDYSWCDNKECTTDKDCSGHTDCYPCKDGIYRCLTIKE